MSRKNFIVLASVVILAGAALAVVTAPWVRSLLASPPGLQAHWAKHYETLGQMVRDADAIVVARVMGTRPGRSMSTSQGAAVLPFTLVDLRVERAVRGSVAALLTLEQTGGFDGERTIYIDGDGGPYDRGEQVLLFLKKQPESGYYYLVNPQGRFAVENGILRAASPSDPVAQRLDARGLDEAIGLIRAGL